MIYNGINAETLIQSTIEGRKGRTAIFYKSCIRSSTYILLKCKNLVYINNKTSNKIRVIVRQMLDKIIDLKELEYRPYLAWENHGRLSGKV